MAQSAALFYPERVDQFLCPTCLKWSALMDERSITEAHIIPNAVGGRLVTLLCRTCNSGFGTRRDRWFGEYIRLFRQDDVTPLHIKEQRGHFHINGVRVGGTFGVSDKGTIELLVHEWRTSPEGRAALAKIARRPRVLSQDPADLIGPSVTVTLPMPPVVEHKDLVTLGFLTAGYLLWFRALGYSWALQKHLDVVREQIRTETLTVLPRSFSGAVPQRSAVPWIGFGTINGAMALFAGIEERVVLFPPADRPHFYQDLPTDTLEGAKMELFGRVDFGEHHAFAGPRAVVYHKRLAVCPDVFFKGRYPLVVVPDSDGPLQVLHPVSHAEAERLKKEHPDRGLSLAINTPIPDSDTGR